MVLASQLRVGMAIAFENQTYRVVAAEYHPGQGKMGGVMHGRLQNIDGYYFYQSQWTEKPVLHLFPHWTWKGHRGEFLPGSRDAGLGLELNEEVSRSTCADPATSRPL